MIKNLASSATVVPVYEKVTGVEKFKKSVQQILNQYPQALLITGLALTALGFMAIGAGCTSLFMPPVSLGLMGAGVLVTVIGAVTLLGINLQWKHVTTYMLAVPLLSLFGIRWTSGMNQKCYEERACYLEGNLLGRLHYIEQRTHQIPVLELEVEDPYQMGLAQGYLLGEQIDAAFQQVLKPMMLFCRILKGDFLGKYYKRQVKAIKIPDAYRLEIKGIVEGVKKWAEERGLQTTITEELALNAHKLTDIYKALGCQRLFGIPFFNVFGCSTTVIKKGKEVMIGRTLDWPSLGKMGELAYIRRHKFKGKQIEMQTFPGIIGALTAYNQDGLVAIINENGVVSRAGTPYAMLARQIIEQASNVGEAEIMIKQEGYQPASSHHLILADGKQAANYQMILEKERKFIKREVNFQKENDFIVVTNHTVDQGQALQHTICDFTSKKRFKIMTDTLTKNLQTDHSIAHLVKKSLSAVNVLHTVATAIYKFKDQEDQKVQVEEYTNDNYWAAAHLA